MPRISWDDINAACDALPGTGNLLYGLTLGTDPGQNYPHQVFEQVAISNNAWPFDAAGNVTMNTPEMIEALAFYTGLQHCALPGPQYWRGAREAYELDQSGMLFYSTYIMDDLVDGSGMEGGGNIEIAVEDLAGNTGFASEMVGPNGSASYGQLVTLGIMQGADPVAQDVVKFFLTGDTTLTSGPGSVWQSSGAEERGGRLDWTQPLLRQLLGRDTGPDCQWLRDHAALALPPRL